MPTAGGNGWGFPSPSNPRATLLLARSPSVRRRSDMRPQNGIRPLCPCTRTRGRVRSTDGTSELGIVATWLRDSLSLFLSLSLSLSLSRGSVCERRKGRHVWRLGSLSLSLCLSPLFWRGEPPEIFRRCRLRRFKAFFFLFIPSSSSSSSSFSGEMNFFLNRAHTLPLGGVVDFEFREL